MRVFHGVKKKKRLKVSTEPRSRRKMHRWLWDWMIHQWYCIIYKRLSVLITINCVFLNEKKQRIWDRIYFVHFVLNVRTAEKQIQANRSTQTYFNGRGTIWINLLTLFYQTPIVLWRTVAKTQNGTWNPISLNNQMQRVSLCLDNEK